ncbi:MAG TPA: hypothetical protein VF189_05060 [Patescibacteria group bacterium]
MGIKEPLGLPVKNNGCNENEDGVCGLRRKTGKTPNFCGEEDGKCYAVRDSIRHCNGSQVYWLRGIRSAPKPN